MDAATRDRAMELLRRAAAAMESAEGEVLMPGWDDEFIRDRERGIRIAAEAIRARGKSPDDGTRIHMRDLGFLIRYVADMLEV